MSIERVLDKIVKHNEPVLGGIVMSAGKVYQNLPERYELVEALDVAEYAENIFELADSLEAGPRGFDQTFMEFEEYSFFTRKLDDGVLVLLTEPIERGTFKKMQVGVNLFMKPLQRELAADPAPRAAVAAAEPQDEPANEPQKGLMWRGIRY